MGFFGFDRRALHDILEEPLILERMVKDEDKKEQKSLEKEG